jgi:hypothetical protein
MRPILAAVLLFLAANQSPTFEVAAVKPSQPGSPSGARLDPARFTCSGMSLRGIIFSAYRIPAWRLSGGPDWLDTDPCDIAATPPPNMPTGRDELTNPRKTNPRPASPPSSLRHPRKKSPVRTPPESPPAAANESPQAQTAPHSPPEYPAPFPPDGSTGTH